MEFSTLTIGIAVILAAGLGWILGRRRTTPGAGDELAGRGPKRVDLTDPAQQTAAAIALFDLESLTNVNRRAGFETGDRLLHAVDRVLRRALPTGVEMNRLDSGRFLVRMPNTPLCEAAKAAERLRCLASETTVESPAGQISCALSAGVVVTEAGENRTHAILRADVALASAKREGGTRTCAVPAGTPPSQVPTRAMVQEALTRRELEFHVQPILRLADRQPVGMEALLRWNRADGRILGPDGFMDTLNRIPEAGADLFPDLAVAAATPFVTGPTPLYTTFNVTGAVIEGNSGASTRWLDEVLERLPPEHLIFELVETAVVVDPDRALALINRVQARGARVALDDFGTGLSNLERLRLFPVDILKIDRRFVHGLNTGGREEAILDSMVALTSGLGVDLIAEGIETDAQATILHNIGVNYGQGFLLGRPEPAPHWAARIAGIT